MTGRSNKGQSQSQADPMVVAVVKEVLKSNDFMQTLSAIIKEAVSTQFEEYMKKQDKVIKDLLADNKTIKAENEILLQRVDRTEQYSRRNNIRIFGIPELENENLEEIVLNVFNNEMDLNIPLENIERCHRVGKQKKNSKPRAVLVKFASYRTRKLVYDNKRKLKSKGITVKEDLTSIRLGMYMKACESFDFKSVWSSDGAVFVKFKSKISRFDEISELEKFIVHSKKK